MKLQGISKRQVSIFPGGAPSGCIFDTECSEVAVKPQVRQASHGASSGETRRPEQQAKRPSHVTIFKRVLHRALLHAAIESGLGLGTYHPPWWFFFLSEVEVLLGAPAVD